MTFNYVSHEKLQYTVNKLLALIGASGGGSGITQQDLDAKENALVQQSVSSPSSITAAVGKYYRCVGQTIGTLNVTLPSMNATKVQGLILNFTTGSSPSVTISSAGNQTIQYFSGYAIEANKSYELNCMWNGSLWIIAYGTIG